MIFRRLLVLLLVPGDGAGQLIEKLGRQTFVPLFLGVLGRLLSHSVVANLDLVPSHLIVVYTPLHAPILSLENIVQFPLTQIISVIGAPFGHPPLVVPIDLLRLIINKLMVLAFIDVVYSFRICVDLRVADVEITQAELLSIGGGIEALDAILSSLRRHALRLLRRFLTVSTLFYSTHEGSFLLDRKLRSLRRYLWHQLLIAIKIVIFLFEIF